MKKYVVVLTDEEVQSLEKGDYVEVESVIEDILAQTVLSKSEMNMLFYWERWLSCLLQEAIYLHQTVENNPLVGKIIKQRDGLRKEIRTKGYRGEF